MNTLRHYWAWKHEHSETLLSMKTWTLEILLSMKTWTLETLLSIKTWTLRDITEHENMNTHYWAWKHEHSWDITEHENMNTLRHYWAWKHEHSETLLSMKTWTLETLLSMKTWTLETLLSMKTWTLETLLSMKTWTLLRHYWAWKHEHSWDITEHENMNTLKHYWAWKHEHSETLQSMKTWTLWDITEHENMNTPRHYRAWKHEHSETLLRMKTWTLRDITEHPSCQFWRRPIKLNWDIKMFHRHDSINHPIKLGVTRSTYGNCEFAISGVRGTKTSEQISRLHMWNFIK